MKEKVVHVHYKIRVVNWMEVARFPIFGRRHKPYAFQFLVSMYLPEGSRIRVPIQGLDVVWFCDNVSACCAMVKGTTAYTDVAHVAEACHL